MMLLVLVLVLAAEAPLSVVRRPQTVAAVRIRS
jgi:hypothetical protein